MAAGVEQIQSKSPVGTSLGTTGKYGTPQYSGMKGVREHYTGGMEVAPGTPGAPAAAPAPAPAPQQPGLPPTGMDQQMQTINAQFQQPQQAQAQPQAQTAYQSQIGGPAQQGGMAPGGGDLNQLATTMAKDLGLPIGRGRIVDEEGNFLMTPEQIANTSGGKVTKGEAAAIMNQIAQGVSKRQTLQGQKQGIAAIQTGLGQVQSRARGSLAAMQSGFYQDLADLYSNQEFETADFSYWIQKEQMEVARELQRRAERAAKKKGGFGGFVKGALKVGAAYSTGDWGTGLSGASDIVDAFDF